MLKNFHVTFLKINKCKLIWKYRELNLRLEKLKTEKLNLSLPSPYFSFKASLKTQL